MTPIGFTRLTTRRVTVRDKVIGAGAPISVQSMTNTKTENVEATLEQVERLHSAGCDIVRIAVPNQKGLAGFAKIRAHTNVPLVADIHFSHELAIGAIEAGADKVRINPGNIGSRENVRKVVDAARAAGVAIRIGVNAGSLEKDILERYIHPVPQALVESALRSLTLLEHMNFDNTVISIKASDIPTTIAACTLLAQKSNVPQHIGITEAGTVRSGTIRSAVGLGALLSAGIGDTLRVSLSGDPVNEVRVAREILKSLHLSPGPVVIACPTCGRTSIDVEKLALQVEEAIAGISATITIAVMGCIVNGPGEAREADIGIAGGMGEGRIFKKGVEIARVPEDQLLERLLEQIRLIEQSSK